MKRWQVVFNISDDGEKGDGTKEYYSADDIRHMIQVNLGLDAGFKIIGEVEVVDIPKGAKL